jgi:phosphate transport system substrate-binding protein
LTRPLFIYVNRASAARPEVKAFTHFYLAPASRQIVSNIGNVPLPDPALVTQAARFDQGITGSALGGHGSVTGVKLDAFDQMEKERERVRNELVQ